MWADADGTDLRLLTCEPIGSDVGNIASTMRDERQACERRRLGCRLTAGVIAARHNGCKSID
jgi:hypothetical protein